MGMSWLKSEVLLKDLSLFSSRPVLSSKWISSVSLTLPCSALPSSAHTLISPSIPGLDSRSWSLSCVWAEEVPPLGRQNNSREMQLSGSRSACCPLVLRGVVSHCQFGMRDHNDGVCVNSVDLHRSKDLYYCYYMR